jgi:hypothetical protein
MLGPVFVDGDARPDPVFVVRDPRLGPVFVDGDPRPDPVFVVRDPWLGPVFVKGDPRLGGSRVAVEHTRLGHVFEVGVTILGPVFEVVDNRLGLVFRLGDPLFLMKDPRLGPVDVFEEPWLGSVFEVEEPEEDLPNVSLDKNVGCERTLLSRERSLWFSGSASSKVISLVCSSLAILSRMRKSKGI